jgi:hypothetical protein
MYRNTIWILLILFMVISCRKDLIEEEPILIESNARVIGKGMDCGDSYIIEFKDGIEGLPENSFGLRFYEIGLPDEYKIPGKQITIEFREPELDEIMSCSLIGPSYPQLVISLVY